MIGTTDSYMTKITVFSSSLLFAELQVSLEISWCSRFGTLLQPQLSLEMLQSMKEFTTKIKNVIKKSFFFQSKRRYVFIEGSNWHRQWWLQHLYGKKKKANYTSSFLHRTIFHTFIWDQCWQFCNIFFFLLERGWNQRLDISTFHFFL